MTQSLNYFHINCHGRAQNVLSCLENLGRVVKKATKSNSDASASNEQTIDAISMLGEQITCYLKEKNGSSVREFDPQMDTLIDAYANLNFELMTGRILSVADLAADVENMISRYRNGNQKVSA